MPTKKTPAKKTEKVTAKFSANIPEAMMTECCSKKKFQKKGGSAGALYFFGMLWAAIYYIGAATGFRMGVLGILKAFVRPVFLVHGMMKFIGS